MEPAPPAVPFYHRLQREDILDAANGWSSMDMANARLRMQNNIRRVSLATRTEIPLAGFTPEDRPPTELAPFRYEPLAPAPLPPPPRSPGLFDSPFGKPEVVAVTKEPPASVKANMGFFDSPFGKMQQSKKQEVFKSPVFAPVQDQPLEILDKYPWQRFDERLAVRVPGETVTVNHEAFLSRKGTVFMPKITLRRADWVLMYVPDRLPDFIPIMGIHPLAPGQEGSPTPTISMIRNRRISRGGELPNVRRRLTFGEGGSTGLPMVPSSPLPSLLPSDRAMPNLRVQYTESPMSPLTYSWYDVAKKNERVQWITIDSLNRPTANIPQLVREQVYKPYLSRMDEQVGLVPFVEEFDSAESVAFEPLRLRAINETVHAFQLNMLPFDSYRAYKVLFFPDNGGIHPLVGYNEFLTLMCSLDNYYALKNSLLVTSKCLEALSSGLKGSFDSLSVPLAQNMDIIVELMFYFLSTTNVESVGLLVGRYPHLKDHFHYIHQMALEEKAITSDMLRGLIDVLERILDLLVVSLVKSPY